MQKDRAVSFAYPAGFKRLIGTRVVKMHFKQTLRKEDEAMADENKLFTKPEELVEWLENYDILMWLDIEDARLLFDYMEGHDYQIGVNTDNKMVRVDIAEENGEVLEYSIDEVISIVCEWNYELINSTREEMKNPMDYESFSKAADKLASLKQDEIRLDKMFEKTTFGREIKSLASEQIKAFMTALEKNLNNRGPLEVVSEGKNEYKTDRSGR